MSSADERARARVPHSASDYGAACRTPGLRVVVLLLIALFFAAPATTGPASAGLASAGPASMRCFHWSRRRMTPNTTARAAPGACYPWVAFRRTLAAKTSRTNAPGRADAARVDARHGNRENSECERPKLPKPASSPACSGPCRKSSGSSLRHRIPALPPSSRIRGSIARRKLVRASYLTLGDALLHAASPWV